MAIDQWTVGNNYIVSNVISMAHKWGEEKWTKHHHHREEKNLDQRSRISGWERDTYYIKKPNDLLRSGWSS